MTNVKKTENKGIKTEKTVDKIEIFVKKVIQLIIKINNLDQAIIELLNEKDEVFKATFYLKQFDYQPLATVVSVKNGKIVELKFATDPTYLEVDTLTNYCKRLKDHFQVAYFKSKDLIGWDSMKILEDQI
ncbi:MAG: hypothetical protein AB8G05_17945 [Oligoflexales bacterium]